MRAGPLLSLLFVAFLAAPAFADPGITVDYHDELLRVTLDGSYAGVYYRVWRSGELLGSYNPLDTQYTLCTGDCFITDSQVAPGQTYYYRFDLQPSAGQLVSYGPYAVVVPNTPFALRVWPNPSNGVMQVQVSLPGSHRTDPPLEVDARVLDFGGRTVRVIYAGALQRGAASLTWDGRSNSGQTVVSGVYFLRLTTPIGSSMTRVFRIR